MATQASIDAIQKLYVAFYQRPADVTGLEYWANRADAANGNMTAIVNAFATSTEATANYGSLNTNQLVNKIYTSLFGRAPDAAGLNFYSNAIAAGTMTAGQLALNILDGATGTDATIIANKLTVAKAYTTAMDTTAEILAYSNATAQTNAKNLLGAVNALDTSVTNATNQIPAVMVSNVNNAAATIAPAGTTFTFTASPLDSFTGNASGNNMVSAAYADVQATDRVAGGTGLGDTLTLTNAATALSFLTPGTTNAGNVTGFEKLVLANATNTVTLNTDIAVAGTVAAVDGVWTHITGGTGYDNIVLGGAGAEAINLATVTGVEQFSTLAGGGANDITFSGAAVSGQIVNASLAAIDVTMGNFVNTLNYISGGAAIITGGNTVDTVNVTSGTAVTTIDAVENTTLTATAANAAISVVNTAAQSVNINVAGSANAAIVNLGATGGVNSADTVTLSTAASATGATTINLNAVSTVANLATVDTVVNFKAVGADTVTFDMAAGATGTFRTLTDVATLDIGAINTSLNAKGINLGARDIVAVKIGSDTYVFANTATAGDTVIDALDGVVKLTGTIGSLSNADFTIV